jgi:hypothetical protein
MIHLPYYLLVLVRTTSMQTVNVPVYCVRTAVWESENTKYFEGVKLWGYVWQVSFTKNKISLQLRCIFLLFWEVRQRRLVFINRRFGTIFRGPILTKQSEDKINSDVSIISSSEKCTRGDTKSITRPTSRYILLDGQNISFDASLVIYIIVLIFLQLRL